MMIFIYGIIGLLIGCGLMFLVYRPQFRRLEQSESDARAELVRKHGELLEQARRVSDMAARQAVLEEKLAAQAEKLATQKEELAAQLDRQRIEFKNLANEILEEKSRQFKETNKESLEHLLKPFRENIDGFRQKVEEVYVKEAQQRFSLEKEIKNLNEINLRMSAEANNLTSALKGNSKVQGDWGEMILETILDNSSLVKGVHYQVQESISGEEGNQLRPDVILNLPEGKQIIIDSKVSLTAYVACAECEAPEEYSGHIQRHLKSVRGHVTELGKKEYQKLVNSPDFVIMFIPNEPAFLLAMQHDPAVWNEAYHKKVIISSPTNLFALLKIVDDLWKRDNQSKNALAIAKEGANLYDKFIGFAETLTDLGKSLRTTSDKYDKAMGQLKTGSGNLIRRTEKLRDLGVRGTKALPQVLQDYEEDGTDSENSAAPLQ